jgi:peroxiredoxin
MPRRLTVRSLSVPVVLLTLASFAPAQRKPMHLNPPAPAPTFTTKDVNGITIDLSEYKGQRVFLSFHRNVGCPICNLRFHQVEEHMAEFQQKGLVVIAVYESTAEAMRSYLEGEHFGTIMIPDPEQGLYALYRVERSKGKVMKGMLHGALGKMSDGRKLFRKRMKQDGHLDRIGADFLINADGTLHTAYYGAYVGDNLPLDSVRAFLR